MLALHGFLDSAYNFLLSLAFLGVFVLPGEVYCAIHRHLLSSNKSRKVTRS